MVPMTWAEQVADQARVPVASRNTASVPDGKTTASTASTSKWVNVAPKTALTEHSRALTVGERKVMTDQLYDLANVLHNYRASFAPTEYKKPKGPIPNHDILAHRHGSMKSVLASVDNIARSMGHMWSWSGHDHADGRAKTVLDSHLTHAARNVYLGLREDFEPSQSRPRTTTQEQREDKLWREKHRGLKQTVDRGSMILDQDRIDAYSHLITRLRFNLKSAMERHHLHDHYTRQAAGAGPSRPSSLPFNQTRMATADQAAADTSQGTRGTLAGDRVDIARSNPSGISTALRRDPERVCKALVEIASSLHNKRAHFAPKGQAPQTSKTFRTLLAEEPTRAQGILSLYRDLANKLEDKDLQADLAAGSKLFDGSADRDADTLQQDASKAYLSLRGAFTGIRYDRPRDRKGIWSGQYQSFDKLVPSAKKTLPWTTIHSVVNSIVPLSQSLAAVIACDEKKAANAAKRDKSGVQFGDGRMAPLHPSTNESTVVFDVASDTAREPLESFVLKNQDQLDTTLSKLADTFQRHLSSIVPDAYIGRAKRTGGDADFARLAERPAVMRTLSESLGAFTGPLRAYGKGADTGHSAEMSDGELSAALQKDATQLYTRLLGDLTSLNTDDANQVHMMWRKPFQPYFAHTQQVTASAITQLIPLARRLKGNLDLALSRSSQAGGDGESTGSGEVKGEEGDDVGDTVERLD